MSRVKGTRTFAEFDIVKAGLKSRTSAMQQNALIGSLDRMSREQSQALVSEPFADESSSGGSDTVALLGTSSPPSVALRERHGAVARRVAVGGDIDMTTKAARSLLRRFPDIILQEISKQLVYSEGALALLLFLRERETARIEDVPDTLFRLSASPDERVDIASALIGCGTISMGEDGVLRLAPLGKAILTRLDLPMARKTAGGIDVL